MTCYSLQMLHRNMQCYPYDHIQPACCTTKTSQDMTIDEALLACIGRHVNVMKCTEDNTPRPVAELKCFSPVNSPLNTEGY
jgi:hypothetical protein